MQSLPQLAKIVKKQPRPRKKGRYVKRDEPDLRADIAARRKRVYGKSKHPIDFFLSPLMGAEIGMVMARELSERDASTAWQAFSAFCAAKRTYQIRILGMTTSIKGQQLGMITEPMETDQGSSVDTRDDDEKDRDAINKRQRWYGYLGHLDANEATLVHAAERGDGRGLWADCKPTRAGIATLRAIQRLAEVSEANRKTV